MNSPAPNFRDQRRERIIQVAREVFFEVGYAGASMSMISARLGGSKATLYAYFNSKEDLFEAIIRESCGAMQAIFHAHIGTNDLRQSLTTVGREMMAMILSDWGNRTLQLIIEESRRNPDLPKMFHEVLERNGKFALCRLLEVAHEKGQIDAPDPAEAATDLKALLFSDLQFKRMLNISPAPDEAALSRHVDRVVDIFLTYYELKRKVQASGQEA